MATFNQKNTKHCIVESVIPLTNTQISDIKTQLKLPDDSVIDNQKNTSLVGGMRIRYQGQVIDLSLKHMLDQLKESDNE